MGRRSAATRAGLLLWAAAGCANGLGQEQAESAAGKLSVYQVGAGKAYASLQAVAGLLEPGDVVEVSGNASYLGGVRFERAGTPRHKITIRGLRVNGKRPVLAGGTTTIEFAGNHYVFEGFEVTGGSSRCVFHHAHDVIIRDSVIHDCPAHGLLGADSGAGSLLLEHSEVYRSGRGDRLHQIYMATDETAYPGAVFRMQHCFVHAASGGNNVKSRAERNEIYYNWIEGAYYHELELIGPDGQSERLAREDADVVGNVLYQGYPERTHFVTRVGGDATGQSWGRYRFVNNTIVLGRASSSAVFRVFDGVESLEMHNNVLFRIGGAPVTVLRDVEATWRAGPAITGSHNWVTAGSTAIPSGWTETRSGTDPGFIDPSAKDVRPNGASPLVGAANPRPVAVWPLGLPSPEPLPRYEPPLRGARVNAAADPRPRIGGLDIGAYERR